MEASSCPSLLSSFHLSVGSRKPFFLLVITRLMVMCVCLCMICMCRVHVTWWMCRGERATLELVFEHQAWSLTWSKCPHIWIILPPLSFLSKTFFRHDLGLRTGEEAWNLFDCSSSINRNQNICLLPLRHSDIQKVSGLVLGEFIVVHSLVHLCKTWCAVAATVLRKVLVRATVFSYNIMLKEEPVDFIRDLGFLFNFLISY